MNKIFAVLGPTGSGKTSLALKLASLLPIEVISLDSRQIYRRLDIGTAKPTPSDRNLLKHHLIDIIEPSEKLDVVQYEELAHQAYRSIRATNAIPILVGGSGFYLDTLEHGIFAGAGPYYDIRESLKLQLINEGISSLYAELQRVDSPTALKLKPADSQRIIRALEVYHGSGKPLSWWHEHHTPSQGRWQIVKYILDPSRQQLYSQINNRVESMFNSGLIEEVKSLVADGIDTKYNAMRSIGYQEVIKYLHNELNLDETKDLIQKNTRNYTKRQLTWFRRYRDAFWVKNPDAENPLLIEVLASKISHYYGLTSDL